MRRIRNTSAKVYDIEGGELLVSYATPVAAVINGKVYRTEETYSVTTTRQINEWLRGFAKPEIKPQSFFDDLKVGAK